MTTPPPAEAPADLSPLCPAHFPGASYFGELLDGFYLGQLAQHVVRDLHGHDLPDVAGRYGLFLEDGGCGQLVGLFPGTPAPSPISAEMEARIDAAYDDLGDDAHATIPAELRAADRLQQDWLDGVRDHTFLLAPIDGHRLITLAIAAGYQPEDGDYLSQFEVWLYDRAGRLLADQRD